MSRALSVFPDSTEYEKHASADENGPPSTRTRGAAMRWQPVDAALAECAVGDMVDTFNAAVYQYCPEAADVCHIERVDQLLAARANLVCAEQRVVQRNAKSCAALEVCKATADIVQVMTDVGMQEYRVPATFAASEQASDALEWRASDNNEVDVILLEPRNYLATEAWAQKQGLPLVPTVLQRRMKVDPSTKRLQKRK